ncbi:MAG TPA: hypothetical protein VHL50_03100 [Pyrinomonadaceae bacterium]|nr:hypothetical protein [Pyrinomonadaceae bacterium]
MKRQGREIETVLQCGEPVDIILHSTGHELTNAGISPTKRG